METQITTKSNTQVVQQAFDDFLKGDFPAVINTCTDNVQWGGYSNPDVSPSGMYYGKEGVQEFFSKLAENIAYSYFKPKEFIVQGERIAVLGHHTGTVKKTGKSFDHDWCFTFKMKEGTMQHFFAFVDTWQQSQAYKQ